MSGDSNKWTVAKLGGSNLKTAGDFVTGLETLIALAKKSRDSNFVFVFSALFNLTNELEVLVSLFLQKDLFWWQKLLEIEKRLNDFIEKLLILKDCSAGDQRVIRDKWQERQREFEAIFKNGSESDAALRDQVLAEGELMTLFMISLFLPFIDSHFIAIDPRVVIKTDDNFGNAEILFETNDLVQSRFNSDKTKVFITAGFIGSTMSGETTTVGREGSDYIAAILAKILKADNLYLFKDVGAIFDSMETRNPIKKMTYAELNQKIQSDGPFKAIHPKVATHLTGSGTAILIASPKTTEVGTTIGPE